MTEESILEAGPLGWFSVRHHGRHTFTYEMQHRQRAPDLDASEPAQQPLGKVRDREKAVSLGDPDRVDNWKEPKRPDGDPRVVVVVPGIFQAGSRYGDALEVKRCRLPKRHLVHFG